MRSSAPFRLGWPGFTWEIRFAFTPRLWAIGFGWDEPDPDGRPWIRQTGSIHLLCLAVTVQAWRPDGTPDPDEVTAWLAAHPDRL